MTERDNNTANRVLEYIGEHPDHRLLAFYGGGHVANKEQPDYPTTPWGLQLKAAGVDLYSVSLGHFFDRLPFALPYSEIDTDFAITSKSIVKLAPGAAPTVDAHVFYRESFVQTVTLKDIPSVLVLEKALGYAVESPAFMPAVASLWYRFTGEDLAQSDDIVKHVKEGISGVNTVRAVENLSLFGNLLTEFSKRGVSRPELDRAMFDITCFGNVLNRKPYPLTPGQSAEELWKGVIEEFQKPIKTQLFTAVLFFGTDEEKGFAQERLRELTGQNFKSREEWLDYSRGLWDSL